MSLIKPLTLENTCIAVNNKKSKSIILRAPQIKRMARAISSTVSMYLKITKTVCTPCIYFKEQCKVTPALKRANILTQYSKYLKYTSYEPASSIARISPAISAVDLIAQAVNTALIRRLFASSSRQSLKATSPRL